MKRILTLLVGIFAFVWLMPARANDTVYYYYTNTLHSAVVETNAQGAVVETTYYAPYGQVLNRSMRDGPGYTGHEEDPETGLNYMQQRYYDPQSGRFLSTDPVPTADDGGNFNRYWYVKDNPYRYMDPNGRQEADAAAEKVEETRQELQPPLRPLTAEEYKQELARQELEPQTLGKLQAENAKLLSGDGGRDAERQIQKFVEKYTKNATSRRPTQQQRESALARSRDSNGVERCTYCDRPLDRRSGEPNSAEIDHQKAYSRGGKTVDENLNAACRTCNRSKGAKDLNTQWVPPKHRDGQ